MELGGGQDRGGEGSKVPGLYPAEKWECRKTYNRKNKEGNNSDEENVEHRREIV